MSKSYYGKPRKPVHLSNVHCTGNEQRILSCTYIEFTSLDEKKEVLNESDVAGVICQSSSTSSNPASSSTPSDQIPTTASSDQSADSLPGYSISLVVSNCLIAFVLTVALILAIILAIV